jgi:hypothetical protein
MGAAAVVQPWTFYPVVGHPVLVLCIYHVEVVKVNLQYRIKLYLPSTSQVECPPHSHNSGAFPCPYFAKMLQKSLAALVVHESPSHVGRRPMLFTESVRWTEKMQQTFARPAPRCRPYARDEDTC